ncbi:MAG: polymer-forming cytoskeletal protein [Myxococcota bacterium]|nr:polymer-forming cytoskeletal protein [Myxococcota bacterium]
MPADSSEINALLGHGTEFKGKLTFEGSVRIDGKFEGEVFTDDVLVVGEGAEVRARIEVGTLIVRGGVVVGDIKARDLVEAHAPGRILGNITSPSLYIGKGVVFDGHCRMGEAATVEGPAREQTAAAQPAPAPQTAQGLPPPPTPSARRS